MSTILIAEDTASIAAFVEKGLRAAGYQTASTGDGPTALVLASSGGFDLMILDLGLPGMDGFEVLRQLRAKGSTLPVVILTARDSVTDTVHGLEGGANDYVTKPFQFAELLARVRLRLAEPAHRAGPSAELAAGGIRLDLLTRRARVDDGEPCDLTSREYRLLEVFLNHPGQVLSREQLLGMVWEMDFDPSSNVVDVLVRSLRGKIGASRIETVRGMGYRLVVPGR
ncbi:MULTISPECIES: response regulator transcription factor [unclassified Luteococcus]|uniref:response regulator transcription factor n=1 Tax=unclassified Luteococcus TaxID=2639923 RepID=UPI00313D2458